MYFKQAAEDFDATAQDVAVFSAAVQGGEGSPQHACDDVLLQHTQIWIAEQFAEGSKTTEALNEQCLGANTVLSLCLLKLTSHASWVQDVAEATQALEAVHRQQSVWLRTKAAMLANFSRKLRQELAQAKSQAAELQVAAVQTEVDGLQQLLQQQQDFAHTLDQVCQVGA